MRTTLMTLLALVALAASAVSGAAAAPARTEAAEARATVTVRSSDFGRIVFDSNGRALYAFTKDPRGRSVCKGACARAWPPYIVTGALRAPAGVERSLLGTTRRADGRRQLTFNGHPLYYYVGDTGPGVVRCQNVFEFGGLWLVVRPGGRLVR